VGELIIEELVAGALTEARGVFERLLAGHSGQIAAACRLVAASLKGGGKLLVFGNGGSAADAQHMAAELVGRFRLERRGLPAVALTTDTSVLTALANDYGFESVFERQVRALGRLGDVACGISTSGGSANVARGLAAARELGLRTLALTGEAGGEVATAAEVAVKVPSKATPRIQEAHALVCHIICEAVEAELCGGGNK